VCLKLYPFLTLVEYSLWDRDSPANIIFEDSSDISASFMSASPVVDTDISFEIRSFRSGNRPSRGWKKRMALHISSRHGHVDVVKQLLEKSEIDATDQKGNTALILAAKYGHSKVTRLLISSGAEVNAKNFHNWTALHWAAKYGHLEVMTLLINSGADVNAKKVWEWMDRAASGYLERRHGSDEATDRFGSRCQRKRR